MVELGYGRLLGPRQFGESMSASPDKYLSLEPTPAHFAALRFGQSDCADELNTLSSTPNVAMS
jgi:hypothetical protein